MAMAMFVANGSADKLLPPALSEYARLLHDTDQHAKALPIYARAETELEKIGIRAIDPLGYASLLDDYAKSLTAAGFAERAAAIEHKVAEIEREHAGEHPKFVARRYKT